LLEETISSFNAFQHLFQSRQKWTLIEGVIKSCAIWHLVNQRASKREISEILPIQIPKLNWDEAGVSHNPREDYYSV
jgi:hypothetical protein